MRVFGQVHGDLRQALIEYLDGIDPRQVQKSTHGLGIEIRIAVVRPAVYDPYWQHDELCIEVDLTWWTPGGRLAPASWRLEHRERIVAALCERNWAAVHFPDLPLANSTDNPDDEATPLAPDPHILARVAETVMAFYCPAPEQGEVSVGVS